MLDVRIDGLTGKEALEEIRLFLSSDRGHHIITVNSEMIVRAQEDNGFRLIIDGADLAVADGMGVLRAASFLGRKKGKFWPDFMDLVLVTFYSVLIPKKITDILPEKISGIDLIYRICESDFAENKKIYLLGAGEGIAQKAGKVLEEKYPHIKIVGAEEGFFSNLAPGENEKLIGRINSKNPDIIFVALGVPRQEKWIYQNLKRMPSVRFAMGVGGSFDVISGQIRRAPEIMQEHGLEWLWRLILQPRRIVRIYNATFKLTWLLFRNKEDMMEK